MVALGRALVALTVAGFALAALGVLVGAPWWAPVTVVAAAASLLQLSVWFHWWLPLGVLIDVALIAGVMWGPWSGG